MSHDISVPPNEADFFDLLKDETRRDAADATRALVRCICNFVRYDIHSKWKRAFYCLIPGSRLFEFSVLRSVDAAKRNVKPLKVP